MAKKAKLAARYGMIEKSPERSGLSTSQKLVYAGLALIGVLGGAIFFGGMSVKKEGDHYRIVRRHHAARPAADRTGRPELPTTRLDGRLVG